uniref:Uncharacterized protein n=1 Tax=Monodelphis domestica TaxID=13616 RepID=A0A5F8GZ17_MONDO
QHRKTLLVMALLQMFSSLERFNADLADVLTEAVVDSILTVRKPGEPIDLFIVEIMEMKHKSETDTSMMRVLVLDHAALHPDIKKRVEDTYILTCNVSLEYEKPEVNSGFFFYKSAEEREKLVKAERKFSEDGVKKIELKSVLNSFPLDILAKEGIVSLHRAKKKKMERLSLACGGMAMNSSEELNPDCLGHAGLVYDYTLGEEKFTFIEKCGNPQSVTLMVKGSNKYTLIQIKDAVRDGLRAVKNTVEDGCIVGAGAVEVFNVMGSACLGIQAFVDVLLIITKVLAQNFGFDRQEALVKVHTEHEESRQLVNLKTGEHIIVAEAGIWDNYYVKKQFLQSCTVIATSILLVDDIMHAQMSSLKV